MHGRVAAAELVEQLNSLFGLRHCGRALPRRPHPSAYGQMGRCLSPCLGDLDPNLYRERLDAALRLFVDGRGDGGTALLAHVERQMRAAAAARAFERAAWLRRRLERLERLVGRLGGVLRATHAGARLVLAPHPTAAGRYDVLWIVAGRVLDWAPLREDPETVAARTRAVLAQAPRPALGGWLPPDEVDEVRLVGGWLAAHEARVLELDAAADPAPRVVPFVRSALAA